MAGGLAGGAGRGATGGPAAEEEPEAGWQAEPAGAGREGAAAGRARPGGGAPVPPGLHFVATPIGAARDITLRALDVLAGAEVLAAEDSRRLRQLLAIHGIPLAGRPLLPYHDHNGPLMRPRLLALLAEGRSVAYASDAGTPLVADPGYQLARAAIEAGHPVHAVPGPSAVLAALTVAGLPTDRFLFAGFPPARAGARRAFLNRLAAVDATLVLLESPRRVGETLGDLCEALGSGRRAALARELTKLHEEVLRGTLGELAAAVAGRTIRGEVVLVVGPPEPGGGAGAAGKEGEEEMLHMLRDLLPEMPLREAADRVAGALGLPRRRVYQAALGLARGRAGACDGEEA